MSMSMRPGSRVCRPVGGDEDALLDGAAADRQANSRLSCQIKLAADLDGLVLSLPDRQL